MRTSDAEFLRKIRAAFAVEAREHLQALASGLVAMEQRLPERDTAQLEAVFRHTHSLKGAARAAAYERVEAACEALEDIFASCMRGRWPLTSDDFDLLQGAIDLIGELVQEGADGTPSSARGARLQALLVELRRLQASGTRAWPKRGERPDAPGTGTRVGQLAPSVESSVRTSPAGQRANDAPSSAGDSRRDGPSAGASTIDQASSHAATVPAATPAPTTRVATPDLDRLLRSVEELLACRQAGNERTRRLGEAEQVLSEWNRQWQAVQPALRRLRRRAASAAASGSPDAKVAGFLDATFASVKRLEERLGALTRSSVRDHETLDRQIGDLLDQSKNLLLTPFASLADLMPKVVRDLARSQGRPVELRVSGDDVRVDKRLLDQMKDPVIHLLRNAVDHGIGGAAARARAGRPEIGTIRLSARYAGGDKIEIVVEDDGEGFDVDAVRQAAVRCGVVEPAIARQLDDAQAIDLVFRSQITTRPSAGELSGRGLGLAIVREQVESLGGQVSVANAGPGGGARIAVTLPQSVGALRGVFVRAGARTFIVPSLHVGGVARVRHDAIATVRNQPTVTREGRVLPVAALGDLLQVPGHHGTDDSGYLHLVFVDAGTDALALLVDEVIDDDEVLVKRLEPPLLRLRHVAGATVDAAGRVVPILNVADLVKSARSVHARPLALAAAATRSPARRARILLAEDSITSRLLLKGILETAGYEVATCADGLEAFTALRGDAHDLLVSDIEMPRLNGFDLTARIRADPVLADLPVVLVTTLARDEDRERGMDAGANAYIAKGSFDQRELVESVRRLLDLRGLA